MASVTGFLLTRHWRDGPDGVELVFWAHSYAGPLRLVFRGQQAVCFTPADTVLDPADRACLRLERKRLRLRAFDGQPVDGLYLLHQRDLGRLRARAASAGIPLYESDIKPHDRFLMERFITAPLEVMGEAVERLGYLEFLNPRVRRAACDPGLRYVSLDIETDGIDTLRAAFWRFESFALGFVADRLLGRRKLIEEPAGKIEEIRRLFVLLGPDYTPSDSRQVGESLAASLNRWWQETIAREFRLESFLEIEFETHFLRFLMPTIRGAETGSKKRYAGTVRNAKGELELVFKGLESVRSDWTPLAQSFQREFYRRVFFQELWEGFVRETVARLTSDALDDRLAYRKRLRQPLDAYRRNVPPHVQAARKLENPGRVVRYLITINGPEPVSARTSRIDYQHYLDRQLAPIADGILHFLGDSFARLAAQQLELFAP